MNKLTNITSFDEYDFWRNALAGKEQEIHIDQPQSGFYRRRLRKNGPFVPVAIWLAETGDYICLVNGQPADNADEQWNWVCQNPITHEEYDRAMTSGKWSDDLPERISATPGALNSNKSPDEHTQIKQELEDDMALAEELMAEQVSNETIASQVASLASCILGHGTKSDGLRKVEKQPHFDAGKAVDAKWRDVIANAKEFGAKLKKHLAPYLLEQDRLEHERQRKAAEVARRQQEEAREAQERAEQAAKGAEVEAGGDNTHDDGAAEQAAIEAEAAQQKADQAAADAKSQKTGVGRTGAKVSLRTVKSGKITDFDKILQALKDRSEIQELVQSLANRAAKAGVALPGMEIIETRRPV